MSPQLIAALKALAENGVTPEDLRTTADNIGAAVPPQEWSVDKDGKMFTLIKNPNTDTGEESYTVDF